MLNKHTHWYYFNYPLQNKINLSINRKRTEQLEEELNYCTIVILKAEWNSTSVINRKVKGLNFPKGNRVLIAENRKLSKGWYQSRSPHDKTLFNRATQQLTE